jgi:hypothetical protein
MTWYKKAYWADYKDPETGQDWFPNVASPTVDSHYKFI